MSDEAYGFAIYPDGKVVEYKTRHDPDHTIPDDADLGLGVLVARMELVRKRSWLRFGRKIWVRKVAQ